MMTAMLTVRSGNADTHRERLPTRGRAQSLHCQARSCSWSFLLLLLQLLLATAQQHSLAQNQSPTHHPPPVALEELPQEVLKAPPGPRARALPITCPAATVDVVGGPQGQPTDLTAAVTTPDTTYRLAPGAYIIPSTITVSTGVTCLIGDDRSSVIVDITTADASTRAVLVTGGAELKIQGLSFDGQQASLGIKVSLSSLEVEDVTIKGCSVGTDASASGAAIDLSSSYAQISNTAFINNQAAAGSGGALALGNSMATLDTVEMVGNSAAKGGAISLAPSSYLTLSGSNIIANNTAVEGGAVNVFSSTLEVKGTVCATGNTVTGEQGRGGFAFITGLPGTFTSELRVFDGASLDLNANSPDAIRTTADASFVYCGSDTTSSWGANASYSITGPACDPACNSQFIEAANGSSNTCDACAGVGWGTCGCAACDARELCCTNGMIAPNTTVCRTPRSFCQKAAYCDGRSASCPKNPHKPDYVTHCPWFAQGGHPYSELDLSGYEGQDEPAEAPAGTDTSASGTSMEGEWSHRPHCEGRCINGVCTRYKCKKP